MQVPMSIVENDSRREIAALRTQLELEQWRRKKESREHLATLIALTLLITVVTLWDRWP